MKVRVPQILVFTFAVLAAFVVTSVSATLLLQKLDTRLFQARVIFSVVIAFAVACGVFALRAHRMSFANGFAVFATGVVLAEVFAYPGDTEWSLVNVLRPFSPLVVCAAVLTYAAVYVGHRRQSKSVGRT